MLTECPLILPPLALPFPQQIHPDAAAVAARARAWADDVGLYATPQAAERAYGNTCDQFAAWVYPAAPRDRLEVLSCLDLMMFLDDDHADEGVLRSHPLTASPLLEVIEESMSPAWRTRFRAHLADWERANVEAGAHSGPPPAPAEYVPWRRVSSTLIWHFDLVEYACGQELPAAFLASESHRHIVECAADIIAWTNDLFSAPKELAQGEQCNLLAVLAHHHRIGLRDAAHLTIARITDRVQEFLDASAALPADAGHSAGSAEFLREWAESLGQWAGGNLGFCLTSGRYPAMAA